MGTCHLFFSAGIALSSAVNDLVKIQDRIKEDFNKIQNVQNEWISEVFLELGDEDQSDWRKESGVLVTNQKTIKPDVEDRIWGDTGFRVFLSHKSEYKADVANIKNKLTRLGISSFCGTRRY